MTVNPWPFVITAVSFSLFASAMTGAEPLGADFGDLETPDGAMEVLVFLFQICVLVAKVVIGAMLIQIDGLPLVFAVPLAIFVTGSMLWALIITLGPTMATIAGRLIDAFIPG